MRIHMTYKRRLWWFPFIKINHRIEIGILKDSIKIAGTESKWVKSIYEKDGMKKNIKAEVSIFDEIWIGYGNGVCGNWTLRLDDDIMDYVVNKPFENSRGLSMPLTTKGTLQRIKM